MAPQGFIISMKFNNKSILPRRDMFCLSIYIATPLPLSYHPFHSPFFVLRSSFFVLLKPLVLCVPPLKLQSSYYAFTNKTHFSTLADLSNSRIHLPQSIKMATEQYFEDAVVQSNSIGDDKCSFGKWNPVSEVSESENKSCGNFDCSICLDSVHDPVVTLCGHLYCWPCIYKWIQFQTPSSESQENQKQPQCPVCKTEVSESSLVPLYGRGQTTKPTKPSKGKAPNIGIVIPKRPLAPCGVDTPRTPSTSPYGTQQLHHRINPYQSQLSSTQGGSYAAAALPMHGPGDTATQVLNPTVGLFGEMVYARVFGNSITNVYTYPNSYNLAGSASPRVRRHVLQADKSLNRMCFFLFCCFMLCLILF